jgi:type I protein arginine methyltransferase
MFAFLNSKTVEITPIITQVHERMLESFIAARDKYLKPGGMMMPSTADILVAPFTDEQLFNEQNTKSTFWDSNSFYGIDLTPLAVQAKEEYMSQAVVGYFSPDILVSCDKVKHAIDFRTASMRDLQVFEIPVHFRITKTCLLHGLACWYVSHPPHPLFRYNRTQIHTCKPVHPVEVPINGYTYF